MRRKTFGIFLYLYPGITRRGDPHVDRKIERDDFELKNLTSAYKSNPNSTVKQSGISICDTSNFLVL